jgi:predicted lipid-binding transport protein (Tim44 family)
VHLRAPSISRGVVAFIWALVFGLYVWLGGLAVGVNGGTAFIFGAVTGFLVFLLVMAFGAGAPMRQPRRADRR